MGSSNNYDKTLDTIETYVNNIPSYSFEQPHMIVGLFLLFANTTTFEVASNMCVEAYGDFKS